MEFACVMDESVNSLAGAPEYGMADVGGSNHLSVEFNRRIGTELVFTMDVSTDLVNWSKSSSPVEVLYTIDAETERCRIIDSEPVDGMRFVRLDVSLP